MLERRVRIINQLGLHARAAAKLVKLVNTCDSTVVLKSDGGEADAAAILDVLAMAAGYGTFVEIVVDGPDEQEAITKIAELFLDGFGEL